MIRKFTLIVLILATTIGMAMPIVVNCDQGQSVSRTLAKMDKDTPATVFVKGSCTEYVQISGFAGLTLKGLQGATLSQPSTDPTTGLDIYVLLIEGSRSVTVDGLAVHSRSSALSGVGIGYGSSDIRLRNLRVDGAGVFGVIVFGNSHASLARVTARDPGYSTVGVFDMSNAHIEDCLFEHSTGDSWNAGVHVEGAGISMHGTTIRNMQVGIYITGGTVQINEDTSYFPLGGNRDVSVENSGDNSYWGVWIGKGGSLSIGNAKLRISNAGQSWGGMTGGVVVAEGGTMSAGANLVVSGSKGQGVIVNNNSFASLAGSSITGSGHGGLVVTNLSTVSVGGSDPLTEISRNGVDLFCDSRSRISGGGNIANTASMQCTDLLPGDSEPLP
jgi:hypothetical protein